MNVCIIELNDSEIRAGRDAKIILRSPGYAVVRKDRLYTGNDALRLAYLNPRETYNRFWDKLNQDALQTPASNYRHHADLAYAHLMAIYQQCGKPGEILFAVPGAYTRDKLALLLGIAGACPFQAVGIVDSAVAAAAAVVDQGRYQHLDIHLHQAVITQLDAAEQITRTKVEVIDDSGLLRIYAAVSALIADLFIEQSRFDPHHHAVTEQALYDQLPQRLQTLQHGNEVQFEIHYKNTTHQARLRREQLLARLQPIYEKILQRLAPDRTLLLGDRVNTLPGLTELLPGTEVLSAETVFKGCTEHQVHIRSQGPALNFITALPVTKQPLIKAANPRARPIRTDAVTKRPARVTHILSGHQAYPLSREHSYLSAGGAVTASRQDDSLGQIAADGAGQVTVSAAGGHAVFLNGRQVHGGCAVQPGDKLGFSGSDAGFTFICVN